MGGRTQSPSPIYHRHLATAALSKGQHSAADVARKAMEYARRREPGLNSRQRHALAWYRSGEFNKTLRTAHDNEKRILNAYFHFFDDLFFGGCLSKSRRSVYLTKKETKVLKVAGESSTYCRKVHGKCEASGTIWIHRATHITNTHDRGLFCLSTLLHEMLHCFLDIYTCPKPSCRDDLKQLGKQHGFAWQDAAYALEKAVTDTKYLNLPLMLERPFELVLELSEWGNPPIENLGRWGFTKKDLRIRHGR
ncbi:hypothetical protein BDZ45DRAFT_689470 [Acephala macrosclerotiorum]|nr:hypothetical protein BDZ45DRAFT_689470 [Acephala macrosclerotiorum]